MWVARSLGMHAKPVVVLDADGLYAPLRAQVELMVERGFVRPPAAEAVTWTSTVDEALDAVELGIREATTMQPAAEEVLEAEP